MLRQNWNFSLTNSAVKSAVDYKMRGNENVCWEIKSKTFQTIFEIRDDWLYIEPDVENKVKLGETKLKFQYNKCML